MPYEIDTIGCQIVLAHCYIHKTDYGVTTLTGGHFENINRFPVVIQPYGIRIEPHAKYAIGFLVCPIRVVPIYFRGAPAKKRRAVLEA